MPSWAAMALVGGQENCTSGNLFAGTNSYVYPYPAAVTAGNLGVLGISIGSTRSVTAAAGTATTYSVNGATTSWGGGTVQIWKAVTAGTDTTVTITLSGNTSDTSRVCYLEFSGASSDQSGSTANGASHTAVNGVHSSGSVTPPTADNVVVALTQRGNDTWTDDTTPAGWTQVSTGHAGATWTYLIQTAATAQSYDMTSTIARDSGMRIGAFAGAAGAAAPNFFPRRLQVNR